MDSNTKTKQNQGFTPFEVRAKGAAVARGNLLQTGFTLIELLVVVAIIGLLASVIVVATGSARIKARDARRLADIQQTKSGLDIYYSFGAGYPDTASWNNAQSAQGQLSCSGQIALKVPQDPFNVGNPTYAYTYTQGGNAGSGCGGTVHGNYKIQFQTEGATSLGDAGVYYLSPAGISPTAPF